MSVTPEKTTNVHETTPTPSPGEPSSAAAPSSELSWAIMLLVLGSSAGMLFYTKRTGSMLQSLRAIPAAELRLGKGRPPLGPNTKAEAERLRTRIDKDEFY